MRAKSLSDKREALKDFSTAIKKMRRAVKAEVEQKTLEELVEEAVQASPEAGGGIGKS